MARYYVNRLGRFSGPDPMAGSMIKPQSLNRYSYVANDPINYQDASGQFLTALTLFLDRAGFPQSSGCSMDGIDAPCGMVTLFLGGNGVAECENNACNRVKWADDPEGGHWENQQFWAFANGGSGYYSIGGGPGSLHYTADGAGEAASADFEPATQKDHRERRFNIYVDQNGVFSYNESAIGPACQAEGLAVGAPCMVGDNETVPDGTTKVADGHTHPFGSYAVNELHDQARDTRYPDYVGVMVENTNQLGVLRISPRTPGERLGAMCQLSGPPMYGVDPCQ
jgi:hypothetical protein